MRIFNLDKNYAVVCDWQNTRNGFKHIATLLKKGTDLGKTKMCYLNRTWERFEYETILKKIVNLYFKGKENAKYLKVISTFV